MKNYLQMINLKNTGFFLLAGILILNFFLRSYLALERFEYSHDGDLYSWIVKDIALGGHMRLIGQLTSTPGIFIGPLFYYALVPFFLLTDMEPTGVLGFAVILSLLTAVSFFWVFKKLFGLQAGLIASLLQTVLVTRIEHDRWIVPTITTSIWEVWYLYTIVRLSRGEFKDLWILGVLVGLVWHINFSLAPLFILIPIAIFLSKRRPAVLDFVNVFSAAALTSLPLVLFEVRHGFSQTQSFMNAFLVSQGGETGLDKFNHILSQVGGNALGLFLYPFRGGFHDRVFFLILFLGIGLLLVYLKSISMRLYLLLLAWVVSLIGFFTFSTKIISEYYFSSIDLVFMTIVILGLSFVFAKFKKLRIVLCIALAFLCLRNTFIFVTKDKGSGSEYLNKKMVARFIKEDVSMKGFPCVSVTYMTSPGRDFGYRYIFYKENLNLNHQSKDVPNYIVVEPSYFAKDSVTAIFGNIGIIPPRPQEHVDALTVKCDPGNTNLTDSLFGYTD